MSSNISKRHPCKPPRYSILVTPYFIIHDTGYLVQRQQHRWFVCHIERGHFARWREISLISSPFSTPIRKKGKGGWKCNRIRACSSRVSDRDLCDETSLCKYYRSRIGLAGRPVARVTESCNDDSDFWRISPWCTGENTTREYVYVPKFSSRERFKTRMQ